MDKELKSFLRTDLIIIAWVSTNFHNDFVYSNMSKTVKCFPIENRKLIRDKNGQESWSTCQIIIDKNVKIDEKDRIILPDGRMPEIIIITPHYDENGNYYHKTIFTK